MHHARARRNARGEEANEPQPFPSPAIAPFAPSTQTLLLKHPPPNTTPLSFFLFFSLIFSGFRHSWNETKRETVPPHQIVPFPSLSPTMTHGGIASWKKAEGEFVAAGDILAEIQTDKATMEMESMEEGWMAKIIVSEVRGRENLPGGGG